MTNKDIRIIWHALQVPADLLSVVLGFVGAFFIREQFTVILGYNLGRGYIPPFDTFFRQVIIMSLVLILVFTFQGLYNTKFRRPFIKEIPFIFWAVLLWAMVILAWFFITRSFFFSRFVLLAGIGFTFVLIVAIRALLRGINRAFLHKGIGKINVLIVGHTEVSNRLFDYLSKNKHYSVVGFVEEDGAFTPAQNSPDTNFSTDSLERLLLNLSIDEVIYTKKESTLEDIGDLLLMLREHHITFRFIPDVVLIHSTNIVSEYIGNLPVIELKETRLDGWGKIFKRTFDIVLASMALVILFIPFIIIGIIIKINSKGPVFVKLDRINRGKVFKLYKFRSMVQNAHALKKTLMKQNERGDGPLFKMKDDPRITGVGKFLRKTRLDELPQLFNVIGGTMSLVGPRPHEPEEVAKYQKHHKKVLAIKPGMTGMGQTQGASDLSFEEEVKIDTYYIENWSLWLDLEILLKTVWVVIRAKGV